MKRGKEAYNRGYQQGFEDAIEMVKDIIRKKNTEHGFTVDPHAGSPLKWEAMTNGKKTENAGN